MNEGWNDDDFGDGWDDVDVDDMSEQSLGDGKVESEESAAPEPPRVAAAPSGHIHRSQPIFNRSPAPSLFSFPAAAAPMPAADKAKMKAHTQTPPNPQLEPKDDNVKIGSGLFMGMLTNFIDKATQPDQDEPSIEEGWNSDGSSLGLDDTNREEDEDVDTNGNDLNRKDAHDFVAPTKGEPTTNTSENDQQGSNGFAETSGDNNQMGRKSFLSTSSLTISSSLAPNVAEAGATATENETPGSDNGWGDDGQDFDGLDDPVSIDHDDKAEPTKSQLMESGWDEDLNLTLIDAVVEPTAAPAAIPPENEPSDSNASDAWGDDGLDDIDIDIDAKAEMNDNMVGTPIIDHTPPPPPPATASSIAKSTISVSGSGEDNVASSENTIPIVDHTPPPPPSFTTTPIRNNSTSVSIMGGASEASVALPRSEDDDNADERNAWGDDDDLLDAVELDDDIKVEEKVVDHTPPPPISPKWNGTGVQSTEVVHSGESVGTLSIRNTGPVTSPGLNSIMSENVINDDAYEAGSGWDEDDQVLQGAEIESVPTNSVVPTSVPTMPTLATSAAEAVTDPSEVSEDIGEGSGWNEDDDVDLDAIEAVESSSEPKVVDVTPPPPLVNDRTQSASSLAVLSEDGGESVDDSAAGDSLRDPREYIRSKFTSSRRVVDYTPNFTPSRMPRNSIDVSLIAMGAASVGESLDSINEGGEEEEEDDSSARLNKWRSFGALGTADSSLGGRREFAFSFGSPPPTGSSSSFGATSPSFSRQIPLVDRAPLPLTKSQSIAASVDVQCGASILGDLDELGDGDDESTKESMYGKMVDHTPELPESDAGTNGPVPASGEGADVSKLEDDTVRGVAENTDINVDNKQDSDMDDSSHDASTYATGNGTMDDFDARSILGGGRLSIVEENHLVDHVPTSKGPRPTDASTIVLADTSVASGRVGDFVNNDDDTVAANGFGPIVDHTPSVSHHPTATQSTSNSVANSVTSQATGLDTEIKLDEDTIADTRASTNAELPTETAVANADDESHVVDHVPHQRAQSRMSNMSVIAIVDPSDHSTVNPDDTIAGNPTEHFGPVVDQTPVDSDEQSVAPSVAASVAVLVPDAKQEDDLDSVAVAPSIDGDLTVSSRRSSAANTPLSVGPFIGENHLVDRVPQRIPTFRPADGSTMVVIDPLDAISEVGGYEGPEDPRTGRFGLVVDQIPTAPRSALSIATSVATHISEGGIDNDGNGTWIGASTGGGGSVVEADGWDEDTQDLDKAIMDVSDDGSLTRNDGAGDHLVDHVPDVESVLPSDVSTAAVAGASIAARATRIVSDSPSGHGIQAPRPDSEVAESESNGGWDEDEPELEDLSDALEDLPHLVDHIPERPESRPTDASTLVVAEPSEVLSQVDDFGHEEQNFGPVVDQTPPSQLVLPRPVEGSVVVAPPSIVEDDLDEAVEAAVDGDDENVWENDDIDIIEGAPNPQSGNDEDREQLVDYLPPEDDQQAPDVARDASSEMATVGEKSALPPDDPKEDEFGPVVDHTPQPEPAAPAVYETRVEMPDDSPRKAAATPPSGLQVDSVAAIFSVASKEDKDDGLDGDDFGPVVDHLPTASSRASFTPSRGGSTVDALATVSEAEDDLNEGDGWEDDTDAGVLEHATTPVPARASDQSNGEDKNLSVKWVDNLGKEEAVAFRQKIANNAQETNRASQSLSAYFDAVGDSSNISLNTTRYYDPGVPGSSTFDDSLTLDDNSNLVGESDCGSDDGDQTPPSTPRSPNDLSTLSGVGASSSHGIRASGRRPTNEATADCKSCPSSSSIDCPCIESLIALNRGKPGLEGTLRTPEGDIIKINLEKLLEQELVKRKLVEKELEALRATVNSLQSAKSTLQTAGEAQMGVMSKLNDNNKELGDKLSHARDECVQLRKENEEARHQNSTLSSRLADWEVRLSQWNEEKSTLKSQVDEAVRAGEESARKANAEWESRARELQAQIKGQQQRGDELAAKLGKSVSDYATMKTANAKLSSDFDSMGKIMKDKDRLYSEMLAKESAMSAEINQLRGSLEQAAAASSTSSGLQKQVAAMQSDLASKSGECATLHSQIQQMRQQVQTLEDDSVFAKQLHEQQVAKRDELIAKYEKELNEIKILADEARLSKEQLEIDYSNRLASVSASAQTVQVEKDNLGKEYQRLSSEHLSKMKLHKSDLEVKDGNLQKMQQKLTSAEKEIARLNSDLAKQVQALNDAESKSVELLNIRRQHDVLGEALAESKDTIVSLEKKIEELLENQGGQSSEYDAQIKTLKQERDDQILKLDSANEVIQQLSEKNDAILSEKSSIQKKLDTILLRCSNLEKEAERAKFESLEDDAKCAKMEGEIQALRRRIADSNNLSSSGTKSDDNNFEAQCEDLRNQVTKLENELQENQEVMNQIQSDLMSSHKDISEKEKALEALTATSYGPSEIQSQLENTIAERDALATEVAKLREENEEMLVHFGMYKEQLDLYEEQLNGVQSQNGDTSHLTDTITELQTKLDKLAFDKHAEETRLGSIISSLESEQEGLEGLRRQHDTDMLHLNNELQHYQNLAQNAVELRNRVNQLNGSIAEHQREIQQRDGALQDLQYQLRNAGRPPKASAELESFRSTIQSMESAATRGRARIGELETANEALFHELQMAKEKIVSTEQTLSNIEAELGSKLRLLDAELSQKSQQLVQYESERAQLRDYSSSLESELASTKRQLEGVLDELQTVQSQFDALQQQYTSDATKDDAEKAIVRDRIDVLQLDVSTKDEQLAGLKRQIEDLNSDLMLSQSGLDAKSAELQQATRELEALRASMCTPATSRMLELSRDQAENVDEMRSHIISLAKSLEESEGRRAQAIERLERERQGNADSLRRLSENVKRFYSTLSCSDV